MDDERRRTWDARFARRDHTYDFRPSPLLDEATDGVPPGLALDLACGSGRHALRLAERGWRVVAIDGSPVGIEIVREEAARRGFAARVDARVADLEGPTPEYRIEADAFDLVCDFYFLARERFAEIRVGVRPGGRFVAAIHVESAEPSHSFLLAPGELRAVVDAWGWDVLLWREGVVDRPGGRHATAEIVARRP